MSKITKKKVTKVATSDRVATALGHIEAAIAAMALTTPKLTVRQKKTATKARKGSEKVIPTISLLANRVGVNLPLQPTSTMTAQTELASELEPLQKSLQAFLATVDGNVFLANSNSWETATALYGILKKVAKADPEVRTQLAPVQEFFAYRHKPTSGASKKKGTATATAATPASGNEGGEQAAAATQQPGESPTSGSTSASSNGSATASGAGHA